MNIIFLLFIVILICIVIAYTHNSTGSAELVLNKSTYVNKHTRLGYANFESFVNSKKLNMHLICIVGVDKSGRTHLAQMLHKKHGYRVVDERNEAGKMRDIPDIRRDYYISHIPPDITAAEEAIHKKRIVEAKNKRVVVTGNFSDDDLARLFKGNNYNRNFLLIYVQPKEGCAFGWSRATGLEKSAYTDLMKESDKKLKEYKKYRLFILQNDYKQLKY